MYLCEYYECVVRILCVLYVCIDCVCLCVRACVHCRCFVCVLYERMCIR